MAKVTFQGNLVNTNGNLPEMNSQVPEFNLVDKDLNLVSLANFSGMKKLLNIVPSLDTPVCAKSAKNFNEAIKTKSGVVVLTISADLPFAQNRFCSSENVEHVKTLSLMNNNQFAKDYGVLIVDGPLKGLTARAVLILDEKNIVVYRELVNEITNEPNYEKAVELL